MIGRCWAGRRGGGNKYNAKRTAVDGIEFASQKESKRYLDLRLLERAGRVRNIELQPKWDLIVNGVKIGGYKADFRYEEIQHGQWVDVVEDVKGKPSRDYPLRVKLMRAIHGITVRET